MTVLFNKQRYEFFSKSQHMVDYGTFGDRCCSISKDTNFSANHNSLTVSSNSIRGVVQ